MANDKIRVTNHRFSTTPLATQVDIVSLQTSATGSSYVTFAAFGCDSLDIVNTTGTAIEYRRGGTGDTVTIPNNSARMIVGISNASEISLRRVDQSNTQVTVKAEAINL